MNSDRRVVVVVSEPRSNPTTAGAVAFLKVEKIFLFSKRARLLVALQIATTRALQLTVIGSDPGPNPMIASYNTSVVKMYSAVNGMARF
jgi:hypothetical protein